MANRLLLGDELAHVSMPVGAGTDLMRQVSRSPEKARTAFASHARLGAAQIRSAGQIVLTRAAYGVHYVGLYYSVDSISKEHAVISN